MTQPNRQPRWRKASRSGQYGECVEVGAVWRTSSRSAGNGQCVEVGTPWHKASRCDSGNCVEVADLPDSVLVRDSKDPDGPRLTFDRAAWTRFVDAVKSGHLDR